MVIGGGRIVGLGRVAAGMPIISPSLVLAVLVGVFWAAAAVAVRVTSGARVPFVFLLAVTGAWAGDAIGGRIGGLFDAARIGDFRIVPASIGAICGILLVVVIAILAPAPGDENLEPDDSSRTGLAAMTPDGLASTARAAGAAGMASGLRLARSVRAARRGQGSDDVAIFIRAAAIGSFVGAAVAGAALHRWRPAGEGGEPARDAGTDEGA